MVQLKDSICLPDVANLLLYLSDGLEIGRTVEGVTTHEQKFDQIPRDVAPGDIEPPRKMRECKAVVYRHDVRYAVARVDHDARRQTCVSPRSATNTILYIKRHRERYETHLVHIA
jgi:hypothetical protein